MEKPIRSIVFRVLRPKKIRWNLMPCLYLRNGRIYLPARRWIAACFTCENGMSIGEKRQLLFYVPTRAIRRISQQVNPLFTVLAER
jgi:hypothetical protein